MQGKKSGHRDITLNNTGRAQAVKAAYILKKYKIDVIVASPLKRTRETAEIIAKIINKPIVYYENIKEINWGSMEGKTAAETKKEWNDFFNGREVPGVEPLKKFQLRVVTAIDDILSKYSNPLIVSHGGVFGNFISVTGTAYQKTNNSVPYIFIPNPDSSKSLFLFEELK